MTKDDTKIYWKRRALRAEAEMQNMRAIRSVDNSMELKLTSQNAALRVAIAEIRAVLADLDATTGQEPHL